VGVAAAGVLEVVLHSRGDTRRLGHGLAAALQPGDLVVLEGDLGAGKTFLARAIARGLGVPAAVRVTSPTFDLVHELPARAPLLHVDLYRLDEGAALDELGLQDRIGADAIVLCEWGDRFARELGAEGLWLAIAVQPSGTRRCRFEARGARGAALLSRLDRELSHRNVHGRNCPAA
jgi:tRNA threonylcarbamoyladenosine biosynthesis protein TsaE